MPPRSAAVQSRATYVINADSGVGIHLKSHRHRIVHSTQRGPALPVEGPVAGGNMTMADTERAPRGIPGLDELIEGGFWPKSTLGLVGSSGTGKATCAIQFVMHGLERGEQAPDVTLAEPAEH